MKIKEEELIVNIEVLGLSGQFKDSFDKLSLTPIVVLHINKDKRIKNLNTYYIVINRTVQDV